MPQDVIDCVNNLGRRSHAASDLTFAWRDGTPIADLRHEDKNNSTYEPSEGSDSHDDNLSVGASQDGDTVAGVDDKLLNDKINDNEADEANNENENDIDNAVDMAEEAAEYGNNDHPGGDVNEEEHKDGHEVPNDAHDEDEAPIISDDKDNDSSESAGVHNNTGVGEN
jgi:hypothetical protein